MARPEPDRVVLLSLVSASSSKLFVAGPPPRLAASASKAAPRIRARFRFRAFSCVALNFSNSSGHLMSPVASRVRPSRPGRDAEAEVPAEGADDIPAATLDLDAVGIDAGV